MSEERLQKILAHAGVSSRRAAEAIITAGRVRVNGRIVTELGTKADPRKDKVELDGVRLVAETPLYLVLHKPRGVVSTMSDPEGRLTVKDFLKGVTARVYPIGRLDYATSGVLLVTNDGDFSDGLLHPKREVPKTYIVKVSGNMEMDDFLLWSKGVELDDGPTKPAKVTLLRFEGDKTWMELTIKEGRNQQVRRMGEATGFPVMRLVRASFAGISSDGLKPGAWRALTREELHNLKQTYGVPKSLPAPMAPTGAGEGRAGGGRGVRAQIAGVDSRGRARGKPGDRAQPDKIHRGTDEQRERAGRRERPIREGSGREGSAGEAPAREGLGRRGPARRGPAREGSTREAPARRGPAREGSTREAPARRGPAREGSAREGSARQGPPTGGRGRAIRPRATEEEVPRTKGSQRKR